MKIETKLALNNLKKDKKLYTLLLISLMRTIYSTKMIKGK